MKVNFNVVIHNILTGAPLQMPDGVDKDGNPKMKDATLGSVAVEALLYLDPQRQEGGEAKAKAYMLASRIVKDMGQSGTTEITVEEAALLKTKIGEIFSPAVVGPAYELLEQRAIGEA